MSLDVELIANILQRQATVGVVGLGYVGLPLAVAFAEAGFNVVGVDLDQAKIDALVAGTSYIGDISSDQIRPLVESGQLSASTDYDALALADAISICVPTPLRTTRDPDISYIVSAAERIAGLGARGRLIVLESTTYPGTTDEIILPQLTMSGQVPGVDFFLAFSPERIDPGRQDHTIYSTPKVIGGHTPACLEVAVALYGTIVERLIPVTNTATAEMVKLLENTFRAVNIGLVNEVALMCAKLGLDVWEVVEAAATKPYGFMPFYPGPGLGGHCIPIDPLYLSWKLRTLNYTARFIELAAEVNSHMPEYVVGRIVDALNDDGKAVRASKILLLGVAYKPNVSDLRESPALDIILQLLGKGAEVNYHDPYVAEIREDGISLATIDLDGESLRAADCVVIVTHHDVYDWPMIADSARLIVDTRHAIRAPGEARLVSL